MKPFKDYETTKSYNEIEKLPSGYYIGIIKKAEEKEYDWGNRLEISVDITEGEFKDYFATQYRNQQLEDKKWKGVLRLSVPTDDGSERDSWTKRSFKTSIEAVEDSNAGYHWDWNETALKNKSVGLAVRQKEWEYNGKTGFSPEIFKFVSVEAVKSGKLKIPVDKPLNSNFSAIAGNGDFTPVADDDLPF